MRDESHLFPRFIKLVGIYPLFVKFNKKRDSSRAALFPPSKILVAYTSGPIILVIRVINRFDEGEDINLTLITSYNSDVLNYD